MSSVVSCFVKNSGTNLRYHCSRVTEGWTLAEQSRDGGAWEAKHGRKEMYSGTADSPFEV